MAGPRLEDKVAIVTGAASGIGRATAIAMAVEGARVVVADRNGEGARSVADEIRAAGGEAIARLVDVAREESVAGMVAAAVQGFGGLDILHNNAAASDPETMSRDLDVASLDVDLLDHTLAVNTRGPALGCKYALPPMLEGGGGSIINTSSTSANVGDPVRTAYGASKAAVDSLTRYVATQYGKQGIRCNSVVPGVVLTPAVAANIPDPMLRVYERAHLTPRLGRPEDVAMAVVFLASDEAAFVTGQSIAVDGGLLAHHPALAELSDLAAAESGSG